MEKEGMAPQILIEEGTKMDQPSLASWATAFDGVQEQWTRCYHGHFVGVSEGDASIVLISPEGDWLPASPRQQLTLPHQPVSIWTVVSLPTHSDDVIKQKSSLSQLS